MDRSIGQIRHRLSKAPALLSQPMGNGKQKQGVGPYLVGALVKLGIAGLVVVSLATPLAFICAGLMGWALGRQFQDQ